MLSVFPSSHYQFKVLSRFQGECGGILYRQGGCGQFRLLLGLWSLHEVGTQEAFVE